MTVRQLNRACHQAADAAGLARGYRRERCAIRSQRI
jgi:hypothetical protein